MIIDMDYISVKAASEKWSISEQRIQKSGKKTALRVLKNLVGHGWYLKVQKTKRG